MKKSACSSSASFAKKGEEGSVLHQGPILPILGWGGGCSKGANGWQDGDKWHVASNINFSDLSLRVKQYNNYCKRHGMY
eukprot:1155665-Pelagomonas_calceolata.AAC.2